ncbi:hypothetical protein [Geitlerinema sp. PCC 7407]|uniref:hypothetical protein n=1 Tax=Geitlerinema sp. PCC 7407 TaxID=1173025 RepID=UPI00029FF6B7|nr:hypothetical protein [Geitlerinema sp. PCC 7407]AFY67058.1 hypothetical protein GEI7407_2583 [Geitlerinema sp. PCC 7407]
MKLEYLVVRLLLSYDKNGERWVQAVRGDATKLGPLKSWTGTLDGLLDALGEQEWELAAGTTALSATITDLHLVLKRAKSQSSPA